MSGLETFGQVPSEQMLPLMYLIDSICKNHGSPYKELFQQGLVSNFVFIFQTVSEKVRLLPLKFKILV